MQELTSILDENLYAGEQAFLMTIYTQVKNMHSLRSVS
jgi:hypothetical protein